MLWLMSMSAQAGKLAEGFRGLPFGPAAILENPPQPSGCTQGDAISAQSSGMKWVCVVEINGVAVEVNYAVEEGYFYGVQITPPANFPAARDVFAALTAAYGPCEQSEAASGPLPDCRWVDGSSVATWTYNRFTDKSAVSIFSRAVFSEVDAARKAKANAAAQGL